MILDTGAGRNLTTLEAMDPSRRGSIIYMKPEGLRFAADTTLRVLGRVQSVT